MPFSKEKLPLKLTLDTDNNTITRELDAKVEKFDLYSTQGFELLSQAWVKVGWNQKYSYTFSWFGRPIIQLPEDMVRMQEVIYNLKPDVIVETGIAHGGSLIFYASLCKAFDRGRVIGIDIEIRPHNRAALEDHPLIPYVTLIEGSSVDPSIVAKVKGLIKPGEKVLVILDSNHLRQHVLSELRAYSPLVSVGSYIVATDGVMTQVYDAPRGTPGWKTDNPVHAAREFLRENPDFALDVPSWPFNESELKKTDVTYFPEAWLKRTK